MRRHSKTQITKTLQNKDFKNNPKNLDIQAHRNSSLIPLQTLQNHPNYGINPPWSKMYVTTIALYVVAPPSIC